MNRSMKQLLSLQAVNAASEVLLLKPASSISAERGSGCLVSVMSGSQAERGS